MGHSHGFSNIFLSAGFYTTDLGLRGELSLTSANLKRADLKGAMLEEAQLKTADLQFAVLDSAYLGGADFTNADLLKAKTLFGAKIDTTLLKQIKKKYPKLLEDPNNGSPHLIHLFRFLYLHYVRSIWKAI